MFGSVRFAEVDEAAEAVGSICARLDPDGVLCAEAPGMWAAFDRVERLAAGAKLRLARRVAESDIWKREGDRSPADWLARTAGASVGQARDQLQASKKLADLDATDDKIKAGELSEAQARAVADAAAANPSAEDGLLDTAATHGLKDLKDACARTKAAADPDRQARMARIHRERHLREWTDAGGGWNLHVRNTPEIGALFGAVLAPYRQRVFDENRRAGRREPTEAYAADAFVDLIRAAAATTGRNDDSAPDDSGRTDDRGAHGDSGDSGDGPSSGDSGDGRNGGGGMSRPKPGGAPVTESKVIALIDYDALRRGYTEGDETSEIVGVGPVPVSTVQAMLADSFLAAVVTDGVDVYNVAHIGRRVTAHMRTALEARGYQCEVPGCAATHNLQIDHVTGWRITHTTKLDDLAWLCLHHHPLKTHHRWQLIGPHGDRRWLPPPQAASHDPPNHAKTA